MKVILFVLFAGYAVRCDDNNYYVIEMVDDPPQKPFKVYWNVPTKQCKSKKIPFDNLYDKFGIIQNDQDSFRGEKVTILYDPGLFPALLKNETSGKFKFRNGGVPQEGNLTKHLIAFKDEIDQSIPDKNFDGIGVIDFESWRPVYRQNFGVLQPYKDVSLEIEKKLHWWWQKKWLEAEAKKRFEESARTFMQTTIAVAKQLRPLARWGFYGFPYCFNMASNNMVETCAANVPEENDNISWLWRESTALFPSVYSASALTTRQLEALVGGRVREAARCGGSKRAVLPYFWYRYRDAGFLTEVDLDAALETLYKSNASGFIIWGSSSDVNTNEKCTKLRNYIEQVMGPAIAKYTKSRRLQNDIGTLSNDTTTDDSTVTFDFRVTTNSNDVATTTSPTNIVSTNRIALDPEYHWIPPDNYTQAIKDHVEEEINKKLNNTETEDKNAVLDHNVLIDLILNSIVNANISKESNVDSTSPTRVNNDAESGELQSSTTNKETKVFEVENTSVTSNLVTNDGHHFVKLDVISSTESTKSFEVTLKTTTQIMDYTTLSITPDMLIDDLTDISSKNIKKSFVQDSLEGFFDVATETPLSTETTEFIDSKTVMIEITTAFNDVTSENKIHKEDNTIAENVTKMNRINTTTKDSREVLTTKMYDIETLTTETAADSTQTSSKSTILTNNEAETASSTTELNLEIKNVTEENNASTKAPVFMNNNKTLQLDLKENATNMDRLSTRAPNFKGYTEIETTTETKFEEEDTSLTSTTTSPEQVSGSAPGITKSQTLYCIIFYFYSVSKCICSIFGHCS